MNHSFLLPPPTCRLNQPFGGETEGGGGAMSSMTRRKFLKRSGGATVAALVAWNLAADSAHAQHASPGTGSSYRLGTTWAGGFYGAPHSDLYREEFLSSALVTRRGAVYQAKIKTWTSPAVGISKWSIHIEFAGEYWEVTTGMGGAPGRTTERGAFSATLPNPYSPNILPVPVPTSVIRSSSDEGYSPDYYYTPPASHPSAPLPWWMKNFFGSITHFPATAIPSWIPTPFPAGTCVVEYWSRPYLRLAPHSLIGHGPKIMDTWINVEFQDRERIIYRDYDGMELHDTGWSSYSAVVSLMRWIQIYSEPD